MRYFTPEEARAYQEALRNIATPTGERLTEPAQETSEAEALSRIAHGLFEGAELCRSLVSDIAVRGKYREAHDKAMDALAILRAAFASAQSSEKALREALKIVCDGNDLAAERGGSIKGWPESYARKVAKAALLAQEEPKLGKRRAGQ